MKKRFLILGTEISVPFTTSTKMVGGVTKEEKIFPAWINQAVRGNWQSAQTSLGRQLLISAVEETAHRLKGLEAPLMCSNLVKVGQVAIAGEGVDRRIVVNPDQHGAWDSDGDRALIWTFNVGTTTSKKGKEITKKMALVVKYPFTKAPEVLQVIPYNPLMEKFKNFSIEEQELLKEQDPYKGESPWSEGAQFHLINAGVEGTVYTPWEQNWQNFAKAHEVAPVGQLTNCWVTLDLLTGKYFEDHPSLGSRFKDIEEGGLKVARKDGATKAEFPILRLDSSAAPSWSWFFISTKRIPSMGSDQVPETIGPVNQFLKKVDNLQKFKTQGFIEAKGREKVPVIDEAINSHLFDALINLGLIRISPIKNEDHPDLTWSVVTFHDPHGNLVALPGMKTASGQEQGTVWYQIIPPVFDAIKLRVDDEVIEPTYRWLSAKEYLKKMFLTIPAHKKDGTPWPLSMEDFTSPSRRYLLQTVQEHILRIIGEVATPLGASLTKDGPKPNKAQGRFIKGSVVIAHGDCSLEEQWENWQKANKVIPLQVVAKVRGGARTIRYAIATETGHPVAWGSLYSHPGRAGKQRSQLCQAQEGKTFKVFVCSNSAKQAFATPSGELKQVAEQGLNPRTISSLNEYKEFIIQREIELGELETKLEELKAEVPIQIAKNGKGLESLAGLLNNLTLTSKINKLNQQIELKKAGLEDLKQGLAGVTFYNWNGSQTKVWIIPAKNQLQLGKLVDEEGNKLMLASYPEQVYLTDGAEVDLLLPMEELLAKGNIATFLKKGTPATAIINNRIVEGLFVEHTMYRTGTASEQIPARMRTAKIRGGDRLWSITAAKTVEKICLEKGIEIPEEIQAILDPEMPEELTNLVKLYKAYEYIANLPEIPEYSLEDLMQPITD